MTLNTAIRILELMTDVYAKVLTGGSANPHHVSQVPEDQWSVTALAVRQTTSTSKAGDLFRVEHGTPRRVFAKMALDLFDRGQLTENSMQTLTKRFWKLAVITIEEDQRLNRIARSKPFGSPEERWAAAGIAFHPK